MELINAETTIGYMLQAYKMAGPYMNFITIFGLLMLVIVIWKIVGIITKSAVNLKWLSLIHMSGSVALALGFLSQITGIVQALDAIRMAGDISPELLMTGATISFYAPIWGFIVFIFSMLSYYILKEVIKARIKE